MRIPHRPVSPARLRPFRALAFIRGRVCLRAIDVMSCSDGRSRNYYENPASSLFTLAVGLKVPVRPFLSWPLGARVSTRACDPASI